MTWLQPLWLAYPTAALLILTALFAWSVRWWLNAFPVTSLNWDYGRKYETPRPATTNYHQVYAYTATSASAIIHFPQMTREQIAHKRAMEDRMWGFLPEVGS